MDVSLSLPEKLDLSPHQTKLNNPFNSLDISSESLEFLLKLQFL